MNKTRNASKKSMFKEAVAAAPKSVASALRDGKRALSKTHGAKVRCGDENRWRGSLELDEALKSDPLHAAANRWDYGLGYEDPNGKESAVWVEVHSAETSEISVVIKKFRWLRDFLVGSCPELWRLTQETTETERFVWVQSGRYAIPANAPQLRALRAAGLERPRKQLMLP